MCVCLCLCARILHNYLIAQRGIQVMAESKTSPMITRNVFDGRQGVETEGIAMNNETAAQIQTQIRIDELINYDHLI